MRESRKIRTLRVLGKTALDRALSLAHTDEEAKRLSILLHSHDRELAQKLSAVAGFTQQMSNLLSAEEKRNTVRRAFGDDWGTFIALHVENLGRRFTIGDLHTLYFDGLEEIGRLQDPLQAERVRRLIAWRDLVQSVQDRSSDAGPLVEAFDRVWRLQPEEVTVLGDFLAHRAFHAAGSLPPALSEMGGSDSQSQRRAGFRATMMGDYHAAWDAYQRAARASQEEGEEPAVEMMTVVSALDAHAAVELEDREEARRPARARLVERRDALRREFGAEAEEIQDDLDHALREQFNEIIPSILHPSRSLRILGLRNDRAGGAERILEVAERLWLHPQWIGRVAELVGQSLWLQGEFVQGAITLCRYGSTKVFRGLIEYEFLGCRRTRVPRELTAMLLREGDTPQAWLSRLAVLSPLAYELDRTENDRLREWTSACRGFLVNAPAFAINGPYLSSIGRGEWDQLTHLAVQCWHYAGLDAFLADYPAWLEALAPLGRYALLSAIGDLPWLRWSAEVVDFAQIESLLVDAIRQLATFEALNESTAHVTALLEIGEERELRRETVDLLRDWDAPMSVAPGLRGMIMRSLCTRDDQRAAALFSLEAWADVARGGRMEYALVQLLDALTAAEQLEVFRKVTARMNAPSPPESMFARQNDLGLALLLGALALRCADEGLRVAALSALRVCMETNPLAVIGIMELDVTTLEREPQLTTKVARLLLGKQDDPTYNRDVVRHRAMQAVNGLIRRTHPGTLPDSWLHAIYNNAIADSCLVSRSALNVLGIVALERRILGDSPSRWAGWLTSIEQNIDHPRAVVRGCCAFAVKTALDADPPQTVRERLILLQQALAEEPNIEVLYGLTE